MWFADQWPAIGQQIHPPMYIRPALTSFFNASGRWSSARTAMVLLASDFVEPYPDRVATFLGYPVSLVQVIATRLTEARIWEGYEIHCERWYDPQHGRVSFIIDVMIATGHIIRVWMEEKNQHGYPFGRHLEASQFAI
jgi:hypothetical protein